MDSQEITVWVDVSSVATGVALETSGTVIEDVCWLRPTNDAQHINLAELNTAFKGVNLALWWEATVLHLVTDSAHVNMRASGEMLVRQRFRTLRSLAKEYGLT